MKQKKLLKIVILLFCVILLSGIAFFYINKTKKMKFGNNSSSQEIINNILNISSYETKIEVDVNSNKNANKYIIKQKYVAPDISEQEVLEPKNIEGIKIVKNKNELKVENTKMNLIKIYNDYEYMTDNCLDLNAFIEDYKIMGKEIYEDKDNEIILTIENKNEKYHKNRTLYISKETGKPTKMEIKDNNKKTLIYILYKEVEFK